MAIFSFFRGLDRNVRCIANYCPHRRQHSSIINSIMTNKIRHFTMGKSLRRYFATKGRLLFIGGQWSNGIGLWYIASSWCIMSYKICMIWQFDTWPIYTLFFKKNISLCVFELFICNIQRNNSWYFTYLCVYPTGIWIPIGIGTLDDPISLHIIHLNAYLKMTFFINVFQIFIWDILWNISSSLSDTIKHETAWT